MSRSAIFMFLKSAISCFEIALFCSIASTAFGACDTTPVRIVAMSGTDVTWTAAGGSFGPLRYIPLYNDTPTSPLDPLISWWDYGSSITINDGARASSARLNAIACDGSPRTMG